MELERARQRKERGISISDLVKELEESQNSYSEIIIVALTKEKGIDVSYSADDDARLIGMLEVAKDILVDDIRGCE